MVCTKDRPTDLAMMIPTVAAQQGPRFRCIVVDQSGDRTANRVLFATLDDDRFVVIDDDRVGKSRALNTGLRATTAPIVAFTDDDCELPAGWLARAVAALDGDVGLAFGNVEAAGHDPSEYFIPTLEFDTDETIEPGQILVPTLLGMGASMVVERSVVERIGGFDEMLGPGGVFYTGEDCEFAYRALRSGVAVRRVPSWKLIHHGRRTLDDDVARRLVVNSFFAIGVGYGKHVRHGDWRAAAISVVMIARNVAEMTTRLIRGRRPLHIRRFLAFVRGVGTGLRAGLEVPEIAAHQRESET
ncbi:MAG: glycosyltransferase family A protein [Ilumatobacteraceae bacterium]|nr:glycosyltransferase family A protein [Ilumatobacteraceae bacterium]